MCAHRQQWHDLDAPAVMHLPFMLPAPKEIAPAVEDEETFFIDDTIQHDALDLGMDFAQSFADLYVDPDLCFDAADAAVQEETNEPEVLPVKVLPMEGGETTIRPDSTVSQQEESRSNTHSSLSSTLSYASLEVDASPATTIFSLTESASTAPTSENESEAPQEKENGAEKETNIEREQQQDHITTDNARIINDEEDAATEELPESLLFAPTLDHRLSAPLLEHARSTSPQRPVRTREPETRLLSRPPAPNKIHKVDVFSEAYDSSDSASAMQPSPSENERLRALKKSALSRFNPSEGSASHVEAEPGSTSSATRMPPPLRVLSPLQEISFKKCFVEEVEFSDKEARDILAHKFPSLCEPPVRMFNENGEPLPPTKKEETSAEERLARKEALAISFRGKKMHSLVKSMVILESRSASWKRVGPAKFLDPNSAPKKALPVVPDPWTLEFYHQDLDKLRTEAKSKRAFEITDSRVEAMCATCKGKGSDVCQTCKGEEADECWWCTGTGKKKDRYRDCEKCNGLGKLKCQACSGNLVGACQPCEGQGYGLFSLIVNIKVRRVDFPPIPDSALLSSDKTQDTSSSSASKLEEKIREAAIQRTRDLVTKLVATSNFRAKIPFRPLTASCAWELSTSKLVEVEVPQAAKMGAASLKTALSDGVRRKKSLSSLRPSGLHRKIATATRYFLLPSDPDLRPASMEKSDFLEALLGEKLPMGPQAEEQIALAYRKFSPVSHSNELPDAPSRAMTPCSSAFPPQKTPLQQMCLSPSYEATTTTGNRPRNESTSSYTTCFSPPPTAPATKTEHDTAPTSSSTSTPSPSYFELLQRSFPKVSRPGSSAGRTRAMTSSLSVTQQYHYQRRISGPVGGLQGPSFSSAPSSSGPFPTTKSLQTQLSSYNMI